MKSVLRKVVTAAGLMLSMMVFALCLILWTRGLRFEVFVRRSALVIENGQELKGVHVFRGAKARVLITFPDRRSAPMIYFPDYQEVGDCNGETFLDLGAFGLQKHPLNEPYPCAGRGKQEIQQDIRGTATSLSFNYWNWQTQPSRTRRLEIQW